MLPDLARYEDKAHDLAHALHEFVTIERLVTLDDWKATRHAPPERRVLMGEALLVRYCEADQEPGVAEQNRENERRRQKREELAAAFRAANPGQAVPAEQGPVRRVQVVAGGAAAAAAGRVRRASIATCTKPC